MSMTLIEHIEVGSGGAASMTFSSIPTDGTYTDLVLTYSLAPDSVNTEGIYILFNGSSANFSAKYLEGNGSTAASGTNIPLYIGAFQGTTANAFGNGQVYIPNYASSNAKSWSVDNVTEANLAAAYQDIIAGFWNDTNPISSITIYLNARTLKQYSSATLYGITAGSDGTTTVS